MCCTAVFVVDDGAYARQRGMFACLPCGLREIGRTETIGNTSDPEFTHQFVLDYFFNETQHIKASGISTAKYCLFFPGGGGVAHPVPRIFCVLFFPYEPVKARALFFVLCEKKSESCSRFLNECFGKINVKESRIDDFSFVANSSIQQYAPNICNYR